MKKQPHTTASQESTAESKAAGGASHPSSNQSRQPVIFMADGSRRERTLSPGELQEFIDEHVRFGERTTFEGALFGNNCLIEIDGQFIQCIAIPVPLYGAYWHAGRVISPEEAVIWLNRNEKELFEGLKRHIREYDRYSRPYLDVSVDYAQMVVSRGNSKASLFQRCKCWALFVKYMQAAENGIANSSLQDQLYPDSENPQGALTTDVSNLNKLIARLGLRVAAHGKGCRRLAVLPGAKS